MLYFEKIEGYVLVEDHLPIKHYYTIVPTRKNSLSSTVWFIKAFIYRRRILSDNIKILERQNYYFRKGLSFKIYYFVLETRYVYIHQIIQ